MEQQWSPNIPEHDARERFLGKWADQGNLAWMIHESESGSIEFGKIAFQSWRVVINNVRWEGDELCFDQYHYSDQPHPFNGVLNTTRLSCTVDPDVLWFETEAVEVQKSANGSLNRIE